MHLRTIARATLALSLLVPAHVAVAQERPASPAPSAGPSAASGEPTTGEGPAAASGLAFEAPRWSSVRPSRGPAAREDHTWTVDAAGRYAYLFGGRDGGNTFADLWRFDLVTDRWERLSPTGKKPEARFGHSAVWVEGHGLFIFAGQLSADFFGDLWMFDPDRGAWKELPARGEVPKARYGSCMIVGPDGRIWISHGFTFAGRFDDTRAYNLRTRRWSSIAPEGRRPGERCLHDCFRSAAGELVLYGGQDNANRALGDLWVTRPGGSWKREADPRLQARRLYAVTEAGDHAWIFGGAGRDDSPLDDLWRVDRQTLEFERVRPAGATPPARLAGTLITDAARGRLLLFGGKGRDARADLWQLGDDAIDGAEAEAAAEAGAIDGEAVATPSTSSDATATPAGEA